MRCFNLWNFLISLLILRFARANTNWKSIVSDLTNNYDFVFGVATSAYQIEGAWNQDGKGESMWDRYTHTHPERIADRSNGDIACDSYNNIDRDIQMIENLNVDYYRFSISWTRVLPDGFSNKINEKGLEYYHNLLDELARRNIKAMVTMYHWDLPQTLQDLGGWENELIVTYFEDYARVLLDNFADKVAMWVTINEPYHICHFGYGDYMYAPEDISQGIGEYLCMHNIHKAHARVYHLYNDMYKSKFNGAIGLVSSCVFYLPFSNSQEDIDAAELANAMNVGWQTNPIYSPKGDYPEIMKERIAKMSAKQGFRRSRLPEFTTEEIEYIRGTYDYLGINYYTARLVKHENFSVDRHPNYENDVGVSFHLDPNWGTTKAVWLLVAPDGLRESLRYIRKRYNNPVVFISEIGCVGDGSLNDLEVVDYYQKHMKTIHDEITENNANVRGWFSWSLMDSFEWDTGYTLYFGLYRTNYSDPKRSVEIKESGKFYRLVNNLAKETRQLYGKELEDPLTIIEKAHRSSNSSTNLNLNLLLQAFVLLRLILYYYL